MRLYILIRERERVGGGAGGAFFNTMNLNESDTCNLYKYFYTYLVVGNMNKLFAKLDVFILKKSEYIRFHAKT